MDTPLTNIPGIGEATAEILSEHGYKNCEDIAKTTAEALAEVHGFGVVRAQRVITMAQDLVATPEATEEALVTTEDPSVEEPIEKQSK
jgi:NAD-dependent DNA ligase